MPIEHIYSGDSIISVCNDECGTAHLYVDRNAVADSMACKLTDTKVEIIDELTYKLKEIEEKYENQLQRTKVHISRGGRVTGSKIHGRRYKVTVSKRSFRNQASIIGCPSGTK
jgi:hypothetical protein